jgi:hypothetical protein
LALRVRGLLEQSPIPKPERHDGGPESDIFRVELLVTEVEAVVQALGFAEAGAVAADGSTTREASRFATLLDRFRPKNTPFVIPRFAQGMVGTL